MRVVRLDSDRLKKTVHVKIPNKHLIKIWQPIDKLSEFVTERRRTNHYEVTCLLHEVV